MNVISQVSVYYNLNYFTEAISKAYRITENVSLYI